MRWRAALCAVLLGLAAAAARFAGGDGGSLVKWAVVTAQDTLPRAYTTSVYSANSAETLAVRAALDFASHVGKAVAEQARASFTVKIAPLLGTMLAEAIK